jgi:GNAT superfamily N-acetyltransferase
MILPAIAEDLTDVRRLFIEYQTEFGFTPCFQGFQDEVDHLPGKYESPRGALLIARDLQGNATGMVALRPTELADTCEMKRLYVTAAARGTRLGHQLLDAIIHAARARNYRHMRLDTFSGKMDRAIAMYRAAGFTDVPAWYDVTTPGIICLSKDL